MMIIGFLFLFIFIISSLPLFIYYIIQFLKSPKKFIKNLVDCSKVIFNISPILITLILSGLAIACIIYFIAEINIFMELEEIWRFWLLVLIAYIYIKIGYVILFTLPIIYSDDKRDSSSYLLGKSFKLIKGNIFKIFFCFVLFNVIFNRINNIIPTNESVTSNIISLNALGVIVMNGLFSYLWVLINIYMVCNLFQILSKRTIQ